MSVSTELTRLQNAKQSLNNTATLFGIIASGENYLLDELAEEYAKIDVFTNEGGEVDVDNTIVIERGYHMGGTYTIRDLSGNYELVDKGTIIPTTSNQTITPGTNPLTQKNYYGIRSLTIGAIPSKYQDVTSVTVSANEVLSGKVYVAKDGTPTVGTMSNNGAVSKVLDATTTSYTIPVGYHSGSGTVSIYTQTKSVTPTTILQTVSPDAGKVLSSVTVNAIPSRYADATDKTATASDILTGKTAISWDSSNDIPVSVTGTMANNGSITKSLMCGGEYKIPAGYHNGNGKVTANSLASQTGVDNGKVAITAETVLTGSQGWVNGSKVSGAMANNGAINRTITGLGSVTGDTVVTIPAGYTIGGSVSLTNDIENALKAI